MAAPNDKEKQLIAQFREDVSSLLPKEKLEQDHYLLRWIRAREHDLDKAKEMIANSMKWREEKQIDSILETTTKPEYFDKHYNWKLHGKCREGRPLLQAATGKWNVRKIVNDGRAEELMYEFARMMEETMKAIDEAGKLPDQDYPITQFIAIADWNEFGYSYISNLTAVQRLLDMVSGFEGHYPESVHSIVFINCPKLFSWLLPLMKACMSGNTIKKLKVYGPNKDEWYPELLKLIDVENLLVEQGGKAVPPGNSVSLQNGGSN